MARRDPWLDDNEYSTALANITPEVVRAYLSDEAARRYRIGYRRRFNRQTREYERYQVEMPGKLSEHSI